jgi:hypothetical protein
MQTSVLVIALAVAVAPAVACGSSGSSGSPDGAADGAGEAAIEDAAMDGAPGDGAALDGAFTEDSSEGSVEVGAPGDAATGTLVVSVDASLQTNGVQGACAAIDAFEALPDKTTVGSAIQLAASGVDANGDASDVTLTWVSSGRAGTLAADTGTSNTFDCTAAGVATVTVMAAISNGGASCPAIGSVAVMLQCDAL